MLDTLISSKTRIKLLLKFFLNPESLAYLRGLESEFGESSNAIRLELNRFEEAGLLNSYLQGNKKIFKVNKQHPLFDDIRNIIMKYAGIDKIVESIKSRFPDLVSVYLIGDYAKGLDTGVIDIALVGDVDITEITIVLQRAEDLIGRKIRYLNISNNNVQQYVNNQSSLLIWKKEA